MTAYLEQVLMQEDESFFIGVFQDNLEQCTWHYHNTHEISFITEGSGKRIVADSMVDFQPGDLVFLGRNLPHVWITDKDTRGLTTRTLEMVYLQFNAEILFPQLLNLPEFYHVKRALELSDSGMQIVGQTLNEVSAIMLQLPYLGNFDRMLRFFSMMDLIGRSVNPVRLASADYMAKRFAPVNKRVATIHAYLMNHYREDVDLKALADLVNMAEGSLCRFFKGATGLTLFEYLNRIKTDFATQLLMDKDLSVTEVCMDSGFNNISHFNKQFKKFTGYTPSLYRHRFIHYRR
jgi:AraC-like DNA-binding protein/mannose-6-phosphate isomerase-like protein (cupin superfamily)